MPMSFERNFLLDAEVVVENVKGRLVDAEKMVLIGGDSNISSLTFKVKLNCGKLLSEIGAVLIADTFD
jgi:hypothetical protein